MQNILLLIEYDGSNFAGWQVQEDERTVQGEILKAIKTLTKQEVKLVGSGRTDKGVHACGQVANFLIDTDILAPAFYHRLKPHLPEDIKIRDSLAVPLDFSARFDANKKTYRYRIYNGSDLHPMYRKYVYEMKYKIDLDKAREAAKKLEGDHDFYGFGQNLPEGVITERDLEEVRIEVDGKWIDIYFTAKAFLRNQVRIMVGTIIKIARNKMAMENIDKVFETKDREYAGPTAPSQGLYLLGVDYDLYPMKKPIWP